MEKKTIYLTEQQYKEIYENALQEALIVNIDLVKNMVKYLNKHFRPIKYDDINADGDVVQPYAIQMLSVDGEPLQTISVDNLLSRLDNVFVRKIKNDSDRHRFFKQVVDDWLSGKISKEGVLSVNVIKEITEPKQPTYLGEIINLSFRDIFKTPLVENDHHVSYIDEYVDIITETINNVFMKNRTLDDFSIKFTEDDFSHIPGKFFDECEIFINYKYDNHNGYDCGYDYKSTIVDEDKETKEIENIPVNERIFNRIYFKIVIELRGNSYNVLMSYLKGTIGHEMTHALQHIRMKMNHDESFTDENYLDSYKAYTRKAATDYGDDESDDTLKNKFAKFLYYTDVNERKANTSEFYNEIGDITEDDITSKEKIQDILRNTTLWKIIDVMGHRVKFYNDLSNEEMKRKLISFYNEYFPKTQIKDYRKFKRIMNGRWNSFYGGIAPKLIAMIREKARKGQREKVYGVSRPILPK